MKTKEELNAIRNEVETLGRKLAELTEDELSQVTGGFVPPGGVVPPSLNPTKPVVEAAVSEIHFYRDAKPDLGLPSDLAHR